MKYKIVKRGQPGIAGGGGPMKYYASPHYSGEIDLYLMGQKLAKRTTVARVDAEAVLSGFADLMSEELSEGKIVRLGNLGTFRISISSRGEDFSQDVNSGSIKKSKVLFRPAKMFKESIAGLSFEKAKDVVANPFDDEVDTTE